MPRTNLAKIGVATAAAAVGAILAITSVFAHSTASPSGESLVTSIVNAAVAAGVSANDETIDVTITAATTEHPGELAAEIAAQTGVDGEVEEDLDVDEDADHEPGVTTVVTHTEIEHSATGAEHETD